MRIDKRQLDQLRGVPEVRARAMFGAHGLYSGKHFFGILDGGRLYFRTDARTQVGYEVRGMKQFTYELRGRVLKMSYYEVPPEVLEDAAELAVWASQAIKAKTDTPRRTSSRCR